MKISLSILDLLFYYQGSPRKLVSVYGELCLGPCSEARDSRHYCAVHGGATQQCGPAPDHTPTRAPCLDQCRCSVEC